MAVLSPAIGKCALIFFAMMIFHEILCIDGRPMKPTIAHNANSLDENYQISLAKLVSRKTDARQKIAEKGEVLSPSTVMRSPSPVDSAAVYVDDFRPTTPGNSPGVGHLFTQEKDVQPKEMDTGGRHVVAVSRNDFRPTEPGYSPRVGHSVKDKEAIAGPNS